MASGGTEGHFGLLDWAVVLAYLAVMFWIGHSAAKKKTDAKGYFLGGRKMPVWAVTLSVVATNLSVATFVGAPQFAFGNDLTYLIVNLGYIIAVFIVAAVFIPKLYAAGTVTIYGYLGQRFGPIAVMAASATFLFGRLLASGVRLFFAAIPVGLLIFRGFDPARDREKLVLAICAIGMLGIAYTVAGGIKAVIWTDVVQIVIVCGAALLSAALLVHRIPLSIGGIIHVLADPATGPHGSKLHLIDTGWNLSTEYTLWAALIGSTMLGMASSGTDHDVAQRLLTTTSKTRASISLIASQFVTAGLQALFLAIGLLLYVYYKRADVMGAGAPRDELGSALQVYPQFLLNHLPTGLRGLAIAGMFAAAQGSLDSAINAMASSAVADIWWPVCAAKGKPVEKGASAKSPRIAVAGIGVLLVGFAIVSALVYDPVHGSLINFALGVMAFAYTGLLGVFLTALVTRRGNATSVICALIAGAAVVTMLQPSIYGWWTAAMMGKAHKMASVWWMPIGTVVSFCVCVMGRSWDAIGSRGFEPIMANDTR
jgi:solute:Na+ symporter, SSS family